jgi:hypothetical protein
MEAFVQNEIARINASDKLSDFENDVKSEIIIWGYERNISRKENGLNPIKQTFKDLANDFWEERINDYGKLRAIRS